jgi:hypothetical protein
LLRKPNHINFHYLYKALKNMRQLLFLLLFCSSVASAQVTDNFSDGDFTSAPTWSGDAAEFIVNAGMQLQLNNTIASASYLSTPSPASSLNNTEWHFYIRQNFAPSGSNYGRVYLASDNANLESPLNGYYVQFGEAGSLDAVELFRQSGSTSTSVCRGTNGQIAAAFIISVRVTRDASGNWSLYVDPAAGSAYALQATGTDNTFTTTSFFGVATVYTISSATKFYFDDFYNGPIIVDTTPPAIVSSTVISNTAVDVLFNEVVDLGSSQLLTNYSADNGLGNPAAAIRDAANNALVHLSFATPFTSGLPNTLTVTNVQDLSANPVVSATTVFTYVAPVVAAYRDIVINEIMADPTPALGMPPVEFLEIYNRSSNTFNLNGWQFSSGTSSATLGSFVLAPGQYLILCDDGDTALFTGANKLGLASLPALSNSGSSIKIKDNTSAVIDSLTYALSWYQDAVKQDGGWTLEQINPDLAATCPAISNWIASTDPDGGTPGFQNSVYSNAPDIIAPTIANVSVIDATHIRLCYSEAVDNTQLANAGNYSIGSGIGTPLAAVADADLTCVELTLANALTPSSTYSISISNIADCSGNALSPTSGTFSYYIPVQYDITVNEIMADPDPVINLLPNAEYIELYNKTIYPVSLNNWTITVGTNTKALPDVIIEADSFLVLTSTTAAPFFASYAAVAGVVSFPAITNSGQTITLRNPAGAVISSVTFDDSWYLDAVKSLGGYSLEQVDPNNPCGGANNWKATNNSNGGTPGAQNSVFASNPDLTAPKLGRVNVIAADTIQVYFNEPLDSTTMLSPALYFIDNGIGNPLSVSPVAPDFKSVRLVLSPVLVNNVIYTITVGGTLKDCAGNNIAASNTARFALPQPAAANDIVINEVLYDPKEGGVDFVEIYNRSAKVIDLKTIIISEYDSIAGTVLNPEIITEEGFQFFPGTYLVLSTSSATVKAHYNTTDPEAFFDVADLPALSNDAGTVCLSSGSLIIDNFTYTSDMQFALLDVTKGVSLERIDIERPTQDRTNWHSAAKNVGYATPGYKNSQYNDAENSSDEVSVSPEIFSPDEDGNNDVVNISYNFDTPGFVVNVMIYDSKGRLVRNLVRNELLGVSGTFSWDGINDDREKERIGIYILFIEVFDLDGNVKRFKKTCVLASKL